MQYELATLTPAQHEAINTLEKELGVVLIAYRPYQPEAPDGRAQAAGPRSRPAGGQAYEIGADLEPDPSVLAALNETYRVGEPAERSPGRRAPARRRRMHGRLRSR